MTYSPTLIKLLTQMCWNHASDRKTGNRWYTAIFSHGWHCLSNAIFWVQTKITVETYKKWPIHEHSLNCPCKCVEIMPEVIGPGTDGLFRHGCHCRSSTILLVWTEITVETCKKWPVHQHSLNCSRKCVKIMPEGIGPGTDGTLSYSGIDSVAGPVPYLWYGLK